MPENREKAPKKPFKLAESRYRKVIVYVLSFVLSLLLVGATLCGVLYLSVFSEKHFINSLGDGYYSAVYGEVVEAAEDITMPTGIDISVVQGVFEYGDVVRDVNGYISAAFRGEEYTPDTENSDNRLYINVSEFLDSHDVTLVEDKKDTINAYIAEVNKEYAQYTRMPGLGIISEYRAKYLKIITIAFVIAAGLSVILGVIIVKMYHHPHRGMRFLAYAFGGTACMSFAAPFVMLVSGKYKGLNFSPQHFYNFAVGYISDALKSCLFAALFWLAATVAIAFAIKFIRKKLINESK